MYKAVLISFFIAFAALQQGCSSSHKLVKTPNLYTQSDGYPADGVSMANRTASAEIFYVTDRAPSADKEGTLSYGIERSSSMAFGTVTTSFGKDLTWEELADASGTSSRDHKVVLEVSGIEEITRFPETPLPFSMKNGMPTPQAEAMQEQERVAGVMRGALQDRLQKSNEKDVILYIHGFKNDFESATLAMADVWHFTGRMGVPVMYTWPAGNGGLFGYFRDREAGEFSVFHLKETLRLITSIPEVERVHIIAHSRGTDIMTTALRELFIETRSAGKNPREALKIENLILAAPDLDFGVVRQRLAAERFGPAVGRITVYMNQSDQALGISQLLMSGMRFGKLGADDMAESDRKFFSMVKNVAFVNVDGVSGFLGHSYYRQHPGVLSDIVIAIRDRLMPGDLGRPLIHKEINFWRLPKNYPSFESEAQSTEE